MLDELSTVTGRAFDVCAPGLGRSSFETGLFAYAAFTAQEARRILADPDETIVRITRDRLRSGAEALGRTTRRRLGVRNYDEAFEALVLLYGAIGVEMERRPEGEVKIGRCFFADYYSEPVCELMSSLDQGLVSGLFEGASFDFRQRLTGGRDCCRVFLGLGGGAR